MPGGGIVTIFFAGECISPDFNIFDYAIVFDRHLKNGDRVGRKPTLSFYRASLFNEFIGKTISKEDLQKKTKFCNFLYSNGNANPCRDALFYELSKYKTVDSLGKHLNNTGRKPDRGQREWRKSSITCREEYKFSIAAENACFLGYTSEKILSCLQAKTIPVYWGDPSISEELNPKAFINCHQYESFEEVVKEVEKIDNDDELYLQIVNEPWQTKEQIEKNIAADEAYHEFIRNIFTQEKQKAKRTFTGTHPDSYRYWFFNGFKIEIPRLIKKKIKKLRRVYAQARKSSRKHK